MMMETLAHGSRDDASIDLYWLPLGAGDASHCVRGNGRVFEALAARSEHRERRDLYHSALEVRVGGERFVVEMAPCWGNREASRGVVATGPVGLPWLGRSHWFRYEVRRWRSGTIPDIAEAAAGPHRVSSDPDRAQRLLQLVPSFPTMTWGRDELGTGDMWNSNSLVAWLLAVSAQDDELIELPSGGRAPGWMAGLAVANRRRVAARS
jgi:hypothetical protein